MLRVLTLSTLYPDAVRPNFGIFVERQTRELAARADVDLRVVAPLGLPPWPVRRHPRYAGLAALPAAESWRGVDIVRPRFTTVPACYGRFHVAALTRALIPALTMIRRDFAFDIIDAEFFFPDGPAAVALSRHFGVPVSIKARGADIHHWGRTAPTAASVVAAGCAAGGLLAVSAAMKDDMVAIGMPAARIAVHRTGVDLDAFAPADRFAAKAPFGVVGPLVVSLGALIERKGHEIVIDAVAALPGITLLIAGDGPLRASLLARARRLGVAERVRLLGPVAHADLPALLGAADVMALASSSEGLANAWVEALACGTPIVITPSGGAAEVVTEAAAGRIVARDAVSFATAIAALLAAPPLPAAVRAAAIGFSWAANTAALFDHLSAIVAGYRSPAAGPTVPTGRRIPD